jgi:hypothetical protein
MAFNISSVIENALDQIAPKTNLTGGFDLQDFRSDSLKDGIIQDNKFLVWLSLPNIFTDSEFKNRDIILRCQRTTLPEVNVYTIGDYQRYGYGQTERIPYTTRFPEVSSSFIDDAEGRIKKFFQYWNNGTINTDRSSGNFKARGGMIPYQVRYKKDITSQIRIVLYDDRGSQVTIYNLYDCHPIRVTNGQLSWGSRGNYMTTDVVWGFTDFTQNFQDLEKTPLELQDVLRRPINSVIENVNETIEILRKLNVT